MPLMTHPDDPSLPPIRLSCDSCGAGPMDRHRVVDERPDDDQIDEWVMDSVCRATDGCEPVEPDGRCEHGHRSWLSHLGLI